MFDEIRSGDVIAVSGKGFVSGLIQVGTLSLPNVGPLGRKGWAGFSHVGIAASVYSRKYGDNQTIFYESTSFDRPPCYSRNDGIENPKGVQSHTIDVILNGGGDVWHFPLRRPLYHDEESRLIAYLEGLIGRGYDFIGAGRSGGGVVMRAVQRLIDKEDMGLVFCSELVVSALVKVGIMQHKNAGAWSPQRLVRYVLRRGVCERGRLLS